MRKKLYKAKKNWVIGLIAGSALLFGSVAGVNADTNTQNQTNGNGTQSQVTNNSQDGQNETPEEIAEAIDNARRAENIVVTNPIRKPNTQNQTNDNGTQSQVTNKDNGQVNSTVSSTITPSNKKTNSSQNKSGIEETSVSANESKNNGKGTEATSSQTTDTTIGTKYDADTKAAQNVANSKKTGTATPTVSDDNNSSVLSNTSSDISKNDNQNVNANSNTEQENNETNPKEESEETDDDNEYPKKATIVGDENDYILSDYEYSDVSPKNIAIPKKNKSTVSKDDDTEPGQPHVIPKILAHYNNHVGLHKMLFSKTIKRRGQQYTVGLATAPGNQTFITYVKDENGEVIGERSGIEDENIYGEDGRYYGASYFGNANVKWGNNTAVAFGKAEFSNGDPLGELPLIYQNYGKIINTQIKVHMQDNGVLNYKVIWNRNTKEQLAFLRGKPNEQPFAFSLGRLVEKMNNSWFDSTTASPIVKLNDNLYCSYIILDGDTDTPHYIIQFIKVNYPTTRVASIGDNGDDYSPNTLMTSRKIPGVASFMPKNGVSYKSGIEAYSPVSDKNLLGKHNNLAVIAFDKDQTQRILNFQRVFMNTQELSGLSSEQILPYVYGLFDGKNDNDNDKESVTKVIYKEKNGHIVWEHSLPSTNKKTIDITKLNKELTKKTYHFKDSKSGETLTGHYEVSDLSPLKNTIPVGKTSIVRVDFIVDFDLKKATEDYVVDQAVDGAIEKIEDQLAEQVSSTEIGCVVTKDLIAPFVETNKLLKLTLSEIFKGLIYNDNLDNEKLSELRAEIKTLEGKIVSFIEGRRANPIKALEEVEKAYEKELDEDRDKAFDKDADDVAPLSPILETSLHGTAATGESFGGMGTAISADFYGIKYGFNGSDSVQRYEVFSNEWKNMNNANLQGWKTLKAGAKAVLGSKIPGEFEDSHPRSAAVINKMMGIDSHIKNKKENLKKQFNSMSKNIPDKKAKAALYTQRELVIVVLAGLAAGVLAMGAVKLNSWSEKKHRGNTKIAFGVNIVDKDIKKNTGVPEAEKGDSINGGHPGGGTKGSK